MIPLHTEVFIGAVSLFPGAATCGFKVTKMPIHSRFFPTMPSLKEQNRVPVDVFCFHII